MEMETLFYYLEVEVVAAVVVDGAEDAVDVNHISMNSV